MPQLETHFRHAREESPSDPLFKFISADEPPAHLGSARVDHFEVRSHDRQPRGRVPAVHHLLEVPTHGPRQRCRTRYRPSGCLRGNGALHTCGGWGGTPMTAVMGGWARGLQDRKRLFNPAWKASTCPCLRIGLGRPYRLGVGGHEFARLGQGVTTRLWACAELGAAASGCHYNGDVELA